MEIQQGLRRALFVTLTFLLHVDLGAVVDPPTFIPQDKKSFRDTSTSRGYYRQMVIDQDNHYVYVGAMERLYRLNADDITRAHLRSDQAKAFDADQKNCDIRGKDKNGYECKNHIRTIVVNDDKIYSCGTGSFNPVEYEFSKTDLTLVSQPVSRSGQGQCPLDPDDTFACVYVRNGNPGNISALYTGTFRDINRDDPLVHREALVKNNIKYSDLLRTARTGWLEEGAVFVSGFETTEYVYFFLRETAEEFYNDGKTLVSRVARVCKNDKGTASILKNKWTTFLKARLNCSIPGNKPFYFNELRDVKKLGNDRFVGVFTTDNNGLYGSALCTFTLAETSRVFSGAFYKPAGATDATIPTPHPGTCNANSHSLSTSAQHFIERHPFMEEAVAHENNKPLYYEAGVIFTHMAVDRITTKQPYTVYFLATDKGRIYKVAEYEQEGVRKSKIIAVWKPFGSKVETIWSMNLFNGPQYPDMEDRNDYVYVGTDSEVLQLEVSQCGNHALCTSCAQDPHCGWDPAGRRCLRYGNGRVQGLEDSPLTVCNSGNSCYSGRKVLDIRVTGDSAVLKCESTCEPEGAVVWTNQDGPIQPKDGKYVFSVDNGLIILNMTKEDEGDYSCLSKGYYLSSYSVRLPPCNDHDCMFKEEFRHWCTEFDAYRKEYNKWLCIQNSYLYLGTDDEVVQLRVTQCDSYKYCTSCVQDPYCGWNRALDTCEMYSRGFPQGLQDPSIEVCNDVGSCFRGWETLNVRVSGDPVYLKCETMCEPKMPVQWWYRNKPILQQDKKYIFTEDYGMVILNTTKADEGSYMCVSDGKYWLAAYEIRLPDCTDPECMWQEEFRNWCNEFDRYRKEFNNWLCVKNECFSSNNCEPNAIPQCKAP